MIYCLKLDLMFSNHQSFGGDPYKIPSLPIIATLDLMEKEVNIGLWKLGSDTCLIGGHHLPSVQDVINDGWLSSHHLPKGYELFKALCVNCGLNASSRETSVLSLDASASTLSLSKSTIPLPRNPKIWPIVENIQGQTHVLNSIPYWYRIHRTEAIPSPSHEVFNPDSCRWSEISTILEEVGLIHEHIVIGHRIYAVSADETQLVFDSKAGNWDKSDLGNWYESDLSIGITSDSFVVSNVFDVLRNGFGRCFGGVTYEHPSDPLRVLIAILHQDDLGRDLDCPYYDCTVFAVAYLVNSRGQIVCFQRLPEFFDGPIEPFNTYAGVMIDVDEEGKTLCSILEGDAPSCVFINTFTAELLRDGLSEIIQEWGNGNKSQPIEHEFVDVGVKSRYIFRSDEEFKGGIQACFM